MNFPRRLFSDWLSCYIFLLEFAHFLPLNDTAPTFTAPTAPFNYKTPTKVTTETQVVQFTTTGVNGTLTCNLKTINPTSTGFECRVDAGICACYIKAGQRWSNGSRYVLSVEAIDSANPTMSSTFSPLIINFHNVPPIFINLPGTKSNIDVNTVIPGLDSIYTVHATDGDGDLVVFYLYNNTDMFSIHKGTGEIRAAKDLHYLTSERIVLDIGVSDVDDRNSVRVSHGVLTLNVINGNHIPSIHGASTAVVLESAPANTQLCTTTIRDLDNDALIYDMRVDPSTSSALFYFDKTCTCVKTSSPNGLNYERQRKYLISIQVQDKWLASPAFTCTVSVTDDNDPPVFTKSIYPVTVMEETSIIIYPMFTCSDEDAELFTYSFMPVNNSNWFSIDPHRGDITIISPLDRDTLHSNPTYLTVFATDSRGARGSTQVLINVGDLNDNAPTFQKNTYQIWTTQLTGVGTVIGSIAATDADEGSNAKFTYRCSDHSDFQCLSDGSITTSTDLSSVAYGTTTQLICYATDLGNPPRTGTTFVDITKREAKTTTTPETKTSTEMSSWDRTEFIVLFSILMVLVALLLLCGVYFCIRKCITGYCCDGPGEDRFGHLKAEERTIQRSNRVGIHDYDDEERYFRSRNRDQNTEESPRQYPMARPRY